MELTIRDVGRLLCVPEKRVIQWITERALPAQRLNSNYHFNRAELLEWATSERQPFSPELFHSASELSSSQLTSALQVGGVVFDIPGEDKSSVLHSEVQRLSLPEGFDRDEILRLFVARESLSPPHVGLGIAIPHPRHLLLQPGRPSSVTLCFLKTPVPFGASDGQPVHAFFTTIAPNPRVHLHLVARLGLAVRDSGIQRVLLGQSSGVEILAEFRCWESEIAKASVVR